ncbi:hypothetical protein CSPX01_12711 [Colletotrichum filicis]|nr:hypothetical protein CSPX01_12711 [Colletotrichum filicis]
MPCKNTVSNATLESSPMSAHVRKAFTHANLPSWPLTMEMTDAAPSKHCYVSAPEALLLLYSFCQDTDIEASRGTRWGRPGIRNKGTYLSGYAACARVPSDTGVKPCSPSPVEPGILFPRDPAASASPDCFNRFTFKMINDFSKRYADLRCFEPYACQSSSLKGRDAMPASL